MKTIYSFRLFFFAILFCFAFLAPASSSYGQQVTYGNEWINYNQKYYKIKVPTTGIYRLDRAYLQAAGINGVDPRNFQLFRRGKEVAIHVEGEADGSFDANDFIEFYGEKNDGALDRELYKNPEHQVNPFYSLYTDTAAYFLTWSTSQQNRRMVTQETPSSGLTAQPWVWQTIINQSTDQYNRGRRYGENHMTWVDEGEGFMSSSSPRSRDIVINGVSNMYVQGPNPSVEVVIVGSNATSPDVDVFAVNGTTIRLLGNLKSSPYNTIRQTFPLEFSDVTTAGRLTIRLVPKDNINGQIRFSHAKVVFPQRPIMASSSMSFEVASAAEQTLLTFEGTNAKSAIAYDLTAEGLVYRIAGSANSTSKSFVFPSAVGSSNKKGFLWSGVAITPANAQEVKFRNLTGAQANYLIVSHKSLMLPSGASANPVLDYAAYRTSSAGGGFDTLVMEVNQIYDQFFYGDKSAAAIRRFVKYMLANGRPQFLYLLGKGIETEYVNVRKNPNSVPFKDLVPTGGTPGSDIFFSSDWDQGRYEPKLATGRLPAQNPGDVLAYLEKVKQHESLPQNLEWRKNILHLGGGNTIEEGRLFDNYLSTYKRIAEKKFFGANVKTKVRDSNEDLDTLNIANELNNGLSLITFFGHSSSSVSDLDIGYVSNPINRYNNTGKYPMILMNGCNAGNIFTTASSFGEDWLLTPNKGAILFIAHSSYGYPSLLNLFSRTFYEEAFANEEYFGKPMGIIHKQVLKQIENVNTGDNLIAMIEQMDLKGDPAIILVNPEKPDYAINNSSISVKPLDNKPLSASTEKFSVLVEVKNLGKVHDEPFNIRVNRIQENGELLQSDSAVVALSSFRDTIEIQLESRAFVPGINSFEVKVDSRNEIQELDETNNIGELEVFLPASSVIALSPYKYGIVSSQTVKLIGQSTNLLEGNNKYYFEIDTTATFKSPWKRTNVVEGGTVPIWEVSLPSNTSQRDSVVYFWRFRNFEVSSQEDTVWATSSFRFIPDSPNGWSQSNIDQLAEIEGQNVLLKRDSKKIEFVNSIAKTIRIRGVGGAVNFGYPPNSIYIEGIRTIDGDCYTYNPNIMIVVFNDKTLEPYTDMPVGLASFCGRQPKVTYNFVDLRKPENLANLETFLSKIPEGFHVALVGTSNVPYNTLPESLKAQFRSLGSVLIDKLVPGDPFALIGRKGAKPGTVPEVGPSAAEPTPANQQSIFLETQLWTNSGSGMYSSTVIGPAREWKSLHYKLALEQSDSYKLEVMGITLNGEETRLFDNITSSNFDLGSVNASQYPYLRLKMNLSDIENRTAPQLKEWVVLYERVPEGVLRPDLIGVNKYEQISEQATNGKIDLQFAFHNISNVDFNDSLTVETTLHKEDGNTTSKTFKIEPLQKNDTVYFKSTFVTNGLTGANRLRVNVNPRILPEQYYYNNTLELPFTIGSYSGMPPIVDVAIDGTRILDGDIVSPSPLINIVLKDNSGKLSVKQSQKMRVYLTKPGNSVAEEILLEANSDVKLYAADENNDFRIEYNPKELVDGVYLLEVQGLDATDNKLGEPYRVSFQVVNESSISNFYPYPNPFSSKTRFVFTLTGNKVPDKMKLQIMTVTGKVIREIHKEELGPIKIGNNVSEFAWDGTDEYGDKLANGVYLYRVVMDNVNEDIKHRYTTGDKAFKKGYGKIYILR
ncbi:C25 family cysteine peptidase [Sabulibacter ruber]|uniref:putative type IX secretion system sortase PorU2 n=1 Tax=Sabulibacter ruber TaxID=2811901 RepID=UPI001A95B6D0|nr:C25 family cysteine peptidase [Sabulibacter ruber]